MQSAKCQSAVRALNRAFGQYEEGFIDKSYCRDLLSRVLGTSVSVAEARQWLKLAGLPESLHTLRPVMVREKSRNACKWTEVPKPISLPVHRIADPPADPTRIAKRCKVYDPRVNGQIHAVKGRAIQYTQWVQGEHDPPDNSYPKQETIAKNSGHVRSSCNVRMELENAGKSIATERLRATLDEIIRNHPSTKRQWKDPNK